jgi:hypothetical protein
MPDFLRANASAHQQLRILGNAAKPFFTKPPAEDSRQKSHHPFSSAPSPSDGQNNFNRLPVPMPLSRTIAHTTACPLAPSNARAHTTACPLAPSNARDQKVPSRCRRSNAAATSPNSLSPQVRLLTCCCSASATSSASYPLGSSTRMRILKICAHELVFWLAQTRVTNWLSLPR